MDYEFHHLAGGSIVDYAPVYDPDGEYLFFISGEVIKIYSTVSTQLVRLLEGAKDPLISIELDIANKDIIVACSAGGEILSWSWNTAELKSSVKLQEKKKENEITNFKLLNLFGKSELSYALVCVMDGKTKKVEWQVVDRTTGASISTDCNLKLMNWGKPYVEVDNGNFHNLVIAQYTNIYFINYKTWNFQRGSSAHRVPFTALKIHPTEECVATGDERGRIFLWREFGGNKLPLTSLYHWHHTPVRSIAFTVYGANFWSSAREKVLVHWNIELEQKHYLPRMTAEILHIVVNPKNAEVAACMADNGVQIVGTDKQIFNNLQEFTYVTNDKTKNPKFPIGLRLNPRTNTLVLNGRIGSLQFYNTYTKSLIYNLNIVNENALSTERDHILYDTRVTKAAFNIDWMATGEVFNDEQHLPELRLKFWKYEEKSQSYTLNTEIELPHEDGFKAIEFSNAYQVDNLLCATVGDDNLIRIWSLEDSDSIHRKEKTWCCIAQNCYKNFPIESISFSQDGSLLAAGYANTLCVYISENLKMKASLTTSPGLDGSIAKVQVKLPSKTVNNAPSDVMKERKQTMELFTNILETKDDSLLKELKNGINKAEDSVTNADISEKFDEKQKMSLHNQILQMHELNLFQKILIYQRIGLRSCLPRQLKFKVLSYFQTNIHSNQVQRLEQMLHSLNLRHRYKAKYRLQHFTKRKRNYDDEIAKNLVPLMDVLHLTRDATHVKRRNGLLKQDQHQILLNRDIKPPEAAIANITKVQFAAGDYAHLVVACTERRVLIWNLLTLRLQSVLKLSVDHMSFDPQTNLIALVTLDRQLHIFQPNVPLPIYQRFNIPKLYGIAWIPRRHPKNRSINVDWQAQSTLYFLTQTQEVKYLVHPNEKQDIEPPIVFDNVATPSLQYTTFGTFATKSIVERPTNTNRYTGPLLIGNSERTAVQAFMSMAVHTMPPISLLCEDFVKSMLRSVDISCPAKPAETTTTTHLNGDIEMNGVVEGSDSEDDNNYQGDRNTATENKKAMKRKDILMKTEELRKQHKELNITVEKEEESRLRLIAQQSIDFDF
uniref:WD repeat-containing protein 75 second beta-propeller domain-containing protein n=1 Tax=Glossina pallidipes TaxID=7398 RepID=A0A1A9ZPX0_GLOPL